MTDGDFWYATAARLLAPLLFAAATGGRDMADVVHWVETGEEEEVLDLLRLGRRARGGRRRPVGLRQGGAPAQLDRDHARDPARAVRRGRARAVRPSSTPARCSPGRTRSTCAPRPTTSGG